MTSENHRGVRPGAPASPNVGRRVAIVAVLFLTVLSAALALIHYSQHRVEPQRQPVPNLRWDHSEEPSGYRGNAVDTRVLSPEWASGIATAWTIPANAEDSPMPTLLQVEGSTLYVLHYGTNEDGDTTAFVAAYDVSSPQPRYLWRTSGPAPSRLRSYSSPAFISTDEFLMMGGLLVDKVTGEQSLPPWGEDLPMGVVSGVLVTCDTRQSCSGWSASSGQWTQLWSAQTSVQRQPGLGFAPLTRGAHTVIASAGHSSVLVPVDASLSAPQIIDPISGQVTTLGVEAARGSGEVPRVGVASDGVTVTDASGTVTAYDARGAVVDTYAEGKECPTPTFDGHTPSLEELKTYLTTGRAPWTSATVRLETTTVRLKSGGVDEAVTLIVDPTAGGEELTLGLDPTVQQSFPTSGPFSPSDLRASADGSTLYIHGAHANAPGTFMIDTAQRTAHTSQDLHEAHNLTWAFDDLLIGVSGGQIITFTPASD